jgi:hypothetical protein
VNYVLHDNHGTTRMCGSCASWHSEATHPALDAKGNPERFLLVASCRIHKLPKRGSDSCGQWTNHKKEKA